MNNTDRVRLVAAWHNVMTSLGELCLFEFSDGTWTDTPAMGRKLWDGCIAVWAVHPPSEHDRFAEEEYARILGELGCADFIAESGESRVD